MGNVFEFGTIYSFVTGLRRLGRFVRFVGSAAVVFFAVSVVGFFVLVPISIPAASELLQFGIFATSLGAGAVSVLGEW